MDQACVRPKSKERGYHARGSLMLCMLNCSSLRIFVWLVSEKMQGHEDVVRTVTSARLRTAAIARAPPWI